MKRILHDWSDQESQTILKHLVDAMDKDRSRVLIIDMVRKWSPGLLLASRH